jgi:multidrug resistance efflux pump
MPSDLRERVAEAIRDVRGWAKNKTNVQASLEMADAAIAAQQEGETVPLTDAMGIAMSQRAQREGEGERLRELVEALRADGHQFESGSRSLAAFDAARAALAEGSTE